MKRLSDTILNMQESSVRKLTKYAIAAEKRGKKIYKLNIGQPDLHTPKEYYNNIKSYNSTTIEYMPSNGMPELIEAIVKYYQKVGINVGKENIMITTGGSEAILFTLFSLINPGDEVLVFEPYYSNYNTFFAMSGTNPVAVTTLAENGFHFGRNELEAKITNNTKAIMVSNPGNPTGTVLTEEEIAIIADCARKYDLFIIADEVYREMVFDNKELTSFGFVEEILDRLVIIDSVSKRFSACGSRIGCIVSKNMDFMALVSKLCQGRLAVSTIEQYGAAGLFNADKKIIAEIKDEFQRRRDVVYENLIKIPGVYCKKPEGAFYLVAKLPVNDACKFLIWMLEEYEDNGETIMAAPADGFYATEGLGCNEIRIAFVLESEQLMRAIQILANGLMVYNAKKNIA